MSEKLSEELYQSLKRLIDFEGKVLEDAENEVMAGTRADWFTLDDMGYATGVYEFGTPMAITPKGRAALADYEAQQEPTLTDTMLNRDDMARAMHDERTLDSAGSLANDVLWQKWMSHCADGCDDVPDFNRWVQMHARELEQRIAELEAQNEAVASVLRDTLQPHDGNWQTITEGVKLLAHYHKQSVDAIYQIVQQSGCNDMAEMLEALKVYRGALEPIFGACNDYDVKKSDGSDFIGLLKHGDANIAIYVHEQDCDVEYLQVKHLRAAAEAYYKYAKGKSDE